ncbi:alpha/beta hydrolase [Pontivivens insulae]|uniref:Carboxylesterase NlhH n=1 Tax=Pontivivens insulae TaxID=1639689 RepID=A0A2R8ACD8_9RHOB|nr:alpha/beta hydrolase [Pontivivens insulae]RED13817.1 acetyl esterase/lipase [Pontivivens insulae]SPF29891.1 Carboxylesterase NlhH [Pontivivens insulae]
MSFTLDPALFRADAISQETRAFIDRFEEETANLPPAHKVDPVLTRKARDEGRGIFPLQGPHEDCRWEDIPNGRVRLAEGRGRGTYLHIHGGGWTLGRPWHYDTRNHALAEATGLEVAAVEYRLAPENPWPACFDDCLAAALWAAERPGPLFIGGESAGGHLSALTALALRDRGIKVDGVILNYGCFDLDLTPSAALWGGRQLVLSTPTIKWFVANMQMGAEARRAASPLHADLSDMPPALFQIGTLDPLLDDTLMMAARWVGAGNRTELAVYPGGIHAFDAFELEIARAYQEREIAFLNARL